ncbi:hypothetical protein BH09PSE1_BH09PSE1_27050 [soil metagenome]
MSEHRNDPDLAARHTELESFTTDRILRAEAEASGARHVSLIDGLCKGYRCRTLTAHGTPMQFDYGHFTPEGSADVARLIVPQIRAALSTPAQL